MANRTPGLQKDIFINQAAHKRTSHTSSGPHHFLPHIHGVIQDRTPNLHRHLVDHVTRQHIDIITQLHNYVTSHHITLHHSHPLPVTTDIHASFQMRMYSVHVTASIHTINVTNVYGHVMQPAEGLILRSMLKLQPSGSGVSQVVPLRQRQIVYL